MKLLTLQFLTCAVKSCKPHSSSFPLHPTSCTLSRTEMPYSPQFLVNLLPRLDLTALRTIAVELGLDMLMPEEGDLEAESQAMGTDDGAGDGGRDIVVEEAEEKGKGKGKEENEKREEALKKLHTLVMETEIQDGKLKCGHCGFEYGVKEGVGNFLLPPHLV